MSVKPGRFSKRLLSGTSHRSMPLVIPNDHRYDISTNELKMIPGMARSSLKPVPETLQLLETIERPLAVLAIGGPCRTGKSYVLSRVLGSADDFALGHTMNAKTFGIWIGTTVLDCDKFTVLLMDTEGIDSVNAKARDDASILVMTVLLSSYFIYNSIGVPKKDDLQKMSHFAKLATSIAVKDVSAPEIFDLKNYFPDFLWLLRDVILTVPSGRDGKPRTPSEYLKSEVLKRDSAFEETAEDKIGRAILTVFPTIECMIIQPPSADPKVMQDIVAKQDCLAADFNEQVQYLVDYLFQKVRAKNGFMEGKQVDGPLLAAMTRQFLEAVNEPDTILCITNTWQAAVEIRCKKVLDQMAQEYTEEMKQKIAEVGLPMEEDSIVDKSTPNPCTLLGLHRSILLQKIELLMKRVGHFVSGSALSEDGGVSTLDRASLSYELEKCTAIFEDTFVTIQGQCLQKRMVIGGILQEFAQRNYTESRSHCLAVFTERYWSIEEKMQEGDISYTFEKLSEDLAELQEEYYQRAIGPAKWDVYAEQESFVKSQVGNFKRLRGFKIEAFDALQKAAEEKARNDQLNDTLYKLQIQTKNDAEMNEERMIAMKEKHEDEMRRLREELEEKMERDQQKYEDFKKAQMGNIAEITKRHEELEQRYAAKLKEREQMNEQFEEHMRITRNSLAKMNTTQPKRSGGCFVAGTVVKMSNGQELPIEKQSGGIKVLALGGETTTITNEFVNHDLDAGKRLVGFNEDTPFAALHHPFWTTEGWKCLDPETAKEENPDVNFKLLQVGDIIFRIAQTEPLLYKPIKIHKFTFLTLQVPTKIYGLHLDGPRSYHANGYAVMANYPVLTKKRVREGMKKLSEEEKESLQSALSSVKVELTKVLGSWANDAFDDMGLTTSAIED